MWTIADVQKQVPNTFLKTTHVHIKLSKIYVCVLDMFSSQFAFLAKWVYSWGLAKHIIKNFSQTAVAIVRKLMIPHYCMQFVNIWQLYQYNSQF